MAILKSTQVTNRQPIPNAVNATDLIPIVGDYVTTGNEASGDIIEMVPLPAGYVPVDVILDAEDCGTTATTDCGVMSGAYLSSGARTCGAEFMSAKALGTAGVYRMDAVGSSRVAPATSDRSIGLKLSTVSSPATGAKLRMTVLCRPQIEGV